MSYGNLKVGAIYPMEIGKAEGVMVDVDDSGIYVKVRFCSPTSEELKQFDSGKPFQMKLLKLRNIIFPLFKFGNLNWMDAPYSVHLSRNLTHLEVPEEGIGMAMTIVLFDTRTGMLCKNRLIGLSTDMTKKLIKMIQEQKEKPFNKMEYDRNLRDIYAGYSTKKLVKMATSSFRV